jgi:hypothetical protein
MLISAGKYLREPDLVRVSEGLISRLRFTTEDQYKNYLYVRFRRRTRDSHAQGFVSLLVIQGGRPESRISSLKGFFELRYLFETLTEVQIQSPCAERSGHRGAEKARVGNVRERVTLCNWGAF